MRLDSGHPQVGMSEHVHTFHELILVTEGAGDHVYAARRHPFEAGQLWAIAPGVSHAIPDPCEARGHIVVFEARALFGSATPLLHRHAHPLLRAFATPQPLLLEAAVCARLAGRMAELEDELSQRRQRWSAAALALLRLVLIDASRQTPDDPAIDAPQLDPLLSEVFDVIETRFAQPLSLRDVAAVLNREPSRLTTTVRRRTGRSVNDWIEERRMIEARRLLVEQGLPISAVARESGFADTRYFARRFRHRHGVTPAEWRRGDTPED